MEETAVNLDATQLLIQVAAVTCISRCIRSAGSNTADTAKWSLMEATVSKAD